MVTPCFDRTRGRRATAKVRDPPAAHTHGARATATAEELVHTDGELFGVLGGGIELTGEFQAVECPFLTINDSEQRCEAP